MSVPAKCKISVLKEPRKMEVVEVDLPAVGDDEILVKVEGCGICGTDVHEYKGDPFGICPVQLGHEGTGEVVPSASAPFSSAMKARAKSSLSARTSPPTSRASRSRSVTRS